MHEIISFSKEIEFKNMINNITSISLEHTLGIVGTSNIKGDFIISGTYKMTAASQIENDFSYKIPVDIEIDDKYDLSNLVIDIDDFTYEVLNEEVLKVDIELILDKLELKQEKIELKKEPVIEFLDDELISSEELFMEEDTKEDLEIKKNIENKDTRDDYFEQTKEEGDIIIDKIDDSINKVKDEEVEVEVGKEKKVNVNVDTEEKNIDESPSLFASFDSSQETYSTYSVYILRENDSIDEVINKYKTTREQLEEYNDLNNLRIGTKIIIPSTKDE